MIDYRFAYPPDKCSHALNNRALAQARLMKVCYYRNLGHVINDVTSHAPFWVSR
jgi:hypothetical protein